MGMQPIGDFGLNITNVQSLIRLKEMGLESATLSIEMPMADCTAMSPVLPRGIFAYGRLPLMTVRTALPPRKRLPGLPGIPGHVRPAARPLSGGLRRQKKTVDVNPAHRFTTIFRCIWPTGWTNAGAWIFSLCILPMNLRTRRRIS